MELKKLVVIHFQSHSFRYILNYIKQPALPTYYSKSLIFQGTEIWVQSSNFRTCAPATVYNSKIQISQKKIKNLSQLHFFKLKQEKQKYLHILKQASKCKMLNIGHIIIYNYYLNVLVLQTKMIHLFIYSFSTIYSLHKGRSF